MSVGGGIWTGAGGAAYSDTPAVDTAPTDGGNGQAPTSSGYNPITDRGSDAYGLLIGTTPGLVHWFRFGKTFPTWGARLPSVSTFAPFWANSAGAVSLASAASGIPTLVAPIVAGTKGAVRLNSSHLWGFDYFLQPGAHEVMTVEAWVKLVTMPADSAICGQWKTNSGWLLHIGTAGALGLHVGTQAINAATALQLGTLYHIVGVVGGTQGPNPDYLSRIYINGVADASGSFTLTQPLYDTADQFRIGNYAGGAGSAYDAEISEVAIYSRMLQPAEIAAHYAAGI